jgi:hypothetical protein
MHAASALVQELAFRSYCFLNLAERLSTRTGAVVGGLIFAVLHLPGEVFWPLLALVAVVDLTLMACFLTLTRLATTVAVAGDRLPDRLELDHGLRVLTGHGRSARLRQRAGPHPRRRPRPAGWSPWRRGGAVRIGLRAAAGRLLAVVRGTAVSRAGVPVA